MKKFVSLVLILSMALCLAACGKKATDTTYVLSNNGIESKITLHAEGDVIKKMTQISTIPLDKIPEESLSMLDDTIKQTEDQVAGIDGVTYTTDKTDTTLTETIVMDLSKKETLKTLIDKGVLPVDNKDADYLSLTGTGEGFESNGYTKEESK